jgi:hypothetical protein
MAHIEPWAKVKEHSFENLILLCAVCHIRFDRGEIPVASVRQYKANLGLLSHRYTQMELRLLSAFAGKDSGTMIHLPLIPSSSFRYALKDWYPRPVMGELRQWVPTARTSERPMCTS